MNKKILAVIVLLSSLLTWQLSYAELQDPTRPPENFNGEKDVSASTYVLNATIIGQNYKMAVINGLNRKIDDEILGAQVTDIHENTVQLTGPNGKITLFLIGKSIKYLPGGKREENLCMDTEKGSC